jgi:flagellar hook-associated protein 2
MASISSLGIGSGVLTSDVIEQLRAADEERVIKPIEKKIELNSQKQEAYGLVTTYMNTLKANVSSLSYSTIFDNKSVNVSGDAKVDVSSGAEIESFTLETTTLAKQEITQFGSLDSKGATISSGNGVYTITVGEGTSSEKSYAIAYDNTTTLSDFAQKITDVAGTDVNASILETSDGKFNLILSSTATGTDKALSFSDGDGAGGAGTINNQFQAYDAVNNPDGYQEIQSATDAKFKYNGIEITRTTNTIDDLILGVSITLGKEGDKSSIDISQDNTNLIAEMESFVENYNTLISNLNDMTIFDEEAKIKGVFQGDGFIKNISRDVTSSIMQVKNGDSLVNYGITLNRDGLMSFDKTVLEEKLNTDSEAVEKIFTGDIDSNGNEIEGLFTNINEKMNSYTGYGKQLSSYETSLKTDAKHLEKNKLSMEESLNARYEIMKKRFASYDALISKVNASFSSLEMMIQAQMNSDSK